MKKNVLAGVAGFVLGAAAGFAFCRFQPEKIAPGRIELLGSLSSEGRQAVDDLQTAFNRKLDADLADIMADRTRALQALTGASPDRAKAEFFADALAEKSKAVQIKADKLLFDALEKMPPDDRRAYMRHYLKNRDILKKRSLFSVLMTQTVPEQPAAEIVRPRDMIVRRKTPAAEE